MLLEQSLQRNAAVSQWILGARNKITLTSSRVQLDTANESLQNVDQNKTLIGGPRNSLRIAVHRRLVNGRMLGELLQSIP